MEDAVVVVRDGKVAAAGAAAETAIPPGLPVVDGTGGTVMPGIVLPASRLGLSSPQGNAERATPTESVLEEVDPFHPVHRTAAEAGFALVELLPGPGAPGGEGAAVRPAAAGGEGFVVADGGRTLRVDVEPSTGWARGLAGTLDKAKKEVEEEEKHRKAMEEYRAALAEFEARKAAAEKEEKEAKERYEKEKAEAEKEKKPAPKPPEKAADPGKPPAEPKAPKSDPRTEIVREAIRRKATVLVVVGGPTEADRALEALAPYRLRLAFWAGGDTWRIAPRCAAADASVVLRPVLDTEPGTLDRVNPAAVFHAAGCPVAFAPLVEDRRGLEELRVQVGRLVRDGLPREAAMRGLGQEAAAILGLGGRHGLVAPERTADLLLFDGDPLEATARLRCAWHAGVPAAPAGEDRP